MKDLGTHLLLFLCIASVIVTLGVFYSEAEDRKAWSLWPRRMLTFVVGCTALVVIMLICEYTFASLGAVS